MPFQESPEGETKFCIACEIEERVKRGRKITILNEEAKIHTCGKMENTKGESWLDAFRQKYCHYVPGAPGSFQLNDKVTAVSIEIFIQILLSKEKSRIQEEIEKLDEYQVIGGDWSYKVEDIKEILK